MFRHGLNRAILFVDGQMCFPYSILGREQPFPSGCEMHKCVFTRPTSLVPNLLFRELVLRCTNVFSLVLPRGHVSCFGYPQTIANCCR